MEFTGCAARSAAQKAHSEENHQHTTVDRLALPTLARTLHCEQTVPYPLRVLCEQR